MEVAKKVQPSERGETEITDLNRLYLEDNSLEVQRLPKDFVWMDIGTKESLAEAEEFLRSRKEQGMEFLPFL